MLETLIVLVVILVLLALANLVLLWRRGVVAPEVTATADTAEFERRMRDEFERARTSRESSAKELREEVSRSLGQASESMVTTIKAMAATQSTQLTQLQASNEKKLEEMRVTVDEKLQGTLEKRLGESFAQVSKRLEEVHRGLGEMKGLAEGVGDLQRVLSNVKARGTWGEVQLESILEQVLTLDQYDRNVKTVPGSSNHVEFAVRLPGPRDGTIDQVWLPIDSKFPQEDYLRLQDAIEAADPEAAEKASADLGRAVLFCAKEIREKYISPPHTTDFGILFLPIEGLYAEVLRRPDVLDELQGRHRIILAGPTTLTAMLNAFRMGFRTLAIEQRSSEVWEVLGAVKTEFGKFGEVLDKLKRQLGTAQKTIQETGVRTRAMERKLRDVESLPESTTEELLQLPEFDAHDESSSGDVPY
ncbi:MAG: DNA recombination protein RmuC [Planctomycetota bacterium]|nr:DNA recombination protein RmuC [Planctomycetota bacterium]